MKFIVLSLLSISLLTPLASEPELNSNWKSDLENSLHQFMQCRTADDDLTACNRFVGESLKTVYKINDFYSDEKDRYLLANEIYDYLGSSDKWTLLGKADDQNTLNNAQGYANLKKAVVAVIKSQGHGHVALVLPGELQSSGAWGLNVPNSASFRLLNPDASYIGKKLSFAFSSADKGSVKIYGRNY